MSCTRCITALIRCTSSPTSAAVRMFPTATMPRSTTGAAMRIMTCRRRSTACTMPVPPRSSVRSLRKNTSGTASAMSMPTPGRASIPMSTSSLCTGRMSCSRSTAVWPRTPASSLTAGSGRWRSTSRRRMPISSAATRPIMRRITRRSARYTSSLLTCATSRRRCWAMTAMRRCSMN